MLEGQIHRWWKKRYTHKNKDNFPREERKTNEQWSYELGMEKYNNKNGLVVG